MVWEPIKAYWAPHLHTLVPRAGPSPSLRTSSSRWASKNNKHPAMVTGSRRYMGALRSEQNGQSASRVLREGNYRCRHIEYCLK